MHAGGPLFRRARDGMPRHFGGLFVLSRPGIDVAINPIGPAGNQAGCAKPDEYVLRAFADDRALTGFQDVKVVVTP